MSSPGSNKASVSRYSLRARKSAAGPPASPVPSSKFPPSCQVPPWGKPASSNCSSTAPSAAFDPEKNEVEVPESIFAFLSKDKSMSLEDGSQAEPVPGVSRKRRAETEPERNVSLRSVRFEQPFEVSGRHGERASQMTTFLNRHGHSAANALNDSGDQSRIFDWRVLSMIFYDPSEKPCASCSDYPMVENDRIDHHIQKWISDNAWAPDLPLSALACRNVHCNALTCIGCGKRCLSNERGPGTSCCDFGWYAAVWMILCYFDGIRGPVYSPLADAKRMKTSHDASAKRGEKAPKAKSGKKKLRRGNNPRPAAGTGYADDHSGGPDTGYDSETSRYTSSFLGDQENQNREKNESRALELLATFLRQCPTSNPWESANQNGPSGQRDPLSAMFHWSKVLKFVANLWQIGSIEEAYAHKSLVYRAIDLTMALFGNNATRTLITDQTLDPFTPMALTPRGLLTPQFQFPSWDQRCQYRDTSVQQAFGSLAGLASLQLDVATTMPTVFEDAAGQEMLSFCKLIVHVGKTLTPAEAATTKSLPVRTSAQEAEVKEPNAFEAVDGEDFKKSFAKMQSKFPLTEPLNPRRMRALYSEMGILQTSLPSGIFARVSSDRPDMLKVIIVGVEGTPYENGLFEFQILCPPSYPGKPPVVSCTTASHPEMVRFALNPNLYNSGYVCLSLIGTWQGHQSESWQPGKSTLLQVLISIQSMILGTDMPANNEPGGLAIPHKTYNQGVQGGTVMGGMLAWLPVPDTRDSVWKEVVEYHFKTNAAKILESVKNWSKDNQQITSYFDYGRMRAGSIVSDDEDFDGSSNGFSSPEHPAYDGEQFKKPQETYSGVHMGDTFHATLGGGGSGGGVGSSLGGPAHPFGVPPPPPPPPPPGLGFQSYHPMGYPPGLNVPLPGQQQGQSSYKPVSAAPSTSSYEWPHNTPPPVSTIPYANAGPGQAKTAGPLKLPPPLPSQLPTWPPSFSQYPGPPPPPALQIPSMSHHFKGLKKLSPHTHAKGPASASKTTEASTEPVAQRPKITPPRNLYEELEAALKVYL